MLNHFANHFPTHIGKVKSHIDIHYNEVADEGAHSVAAGDAEPEIIFDEADPSIGGLRTWPVHREPKDDAPDVLTNFTNLKTDARAYAKRATIAQNQPTTLFGRLLCNAKTQGADYSIHAYSRSAYIDRRNSLEVAWGVHRYRLQPKFGKHQPLLCGKCQQKLTNTHILGGCYSTSRPAHSPASQHLQTPARALEEKQRREVAYPLHGPWQWPGTRLRHTTPGRTRTHISPDP